MDCLWRPSVRLPVSSGLRLFLLDIPYWMGLPPSVWPRLGPGCRFLNLARWGTLGRLQTCRRISLIISWMSELQKPRGHSPAVRWPDGEGTLVVVVAVLLSRCLPGGCSAVFAELCGCRVAGRDISLEKPLPGRLRLLG